MLAGGIRMFHPDPASNMCNNERMREIKKFEGKSMWRTVGNASETRAHTHTHTHTPTHTHNTRVNSNLEFVYWKQNLHWKSKFTA